ncbi:MAG: O-antigen/teichoic acid export membrane protein, partial [Psychroserpens sp.]
MKEDKNPVSGLKATFIWTAAQVLIKVVCGIIMNKVVAVTLGPSGLALIGQFQNFYSLCVG